MRKSASSLNKLKLAVVGAMVLIALVGWFGGANRAFKASAASSGPTPGHSGAPGEQTCTACHADFQPNSGGGSMTITGLPANYTPGTSYPVTITVNQINAVTFGFQTVALDLQNLQVGNYTLPPQTPQQLQIMEGIINNQTRRYVEHTSAGITPTQFNTKSWTFNWVAPANHRRRVTFYASGNGANSDGSTSGDYIYTIRGCIPGGTGTTLFDNDNKADIAVFRPSSGAWFRLNSTNGQFNAVQFGANGDRIVPGDYDGDGRNDVVVFRPSNGVWYVLRSSDGGFASYAFGQTGDIPLVGDMTGDRRSDLVVFRPSAGSFYRLDLTNNNFAAILFGANGDRPVQGDYDGDGRSDYGVYRPSSGSWFILRSSDGGVTAVQFGTAEDKAVPADYDGDGRTDFAVFRPSNGVWYLLRSTAGFSSVQFGANGDTPAPTDFDGDCQTDIAVFRAGNWFILNSTNSAVTSVPFGLAGDIPVPAGYIAE